MRGCWWMEVPPRNPGPLRPIRASLSCRPCESRDPYAAAFQLSDVAITFCYKQRRWLWVPAPVRNCALVVHHSDFDVLIPSHSRIGKLSGGTRISLLLGTPG